jgi:hypothetical protein
MMNLKSLSFEAQSRSVEPLRFNAAALSFNLEPLRFNY